MAQAVYAPENSGHFGLSLDGYAHFTSPIRRYPDLLVHRAIQHVLDGGTADRYRYSQSDMEAIGQHATLTERRADEATRDVVDWLKCEFMMDQVGQEFPGKITSVTSFGLFVGLDDIHVEGLIHVTALANDYYHFDAVNHLMRGEHSGQTFRLADAIKISVARVDLDERKIDFIPAGDQAAEARGKSRRARSKADRDEFDHSKKAKSRNKNRAKGKGKAKSKDKGKRPRH